MSRFALNGSCLTTTEGGNRCVCLKGTRAGAETTPQAFESTIINPLIIPDVRTLSSLEQSRTIFNHHPCLPPRLARLPIRHTTNYQSPCPSPNVPIPVRVLVSAFRL